MNPSQISPRFLDFLIQRIQQERAVLVLGPDLYRNESGQSMEVRLMEYLHDKNESERPFFNRYYSEEHLFHVNGSSELAMLGFEVSDFYEQQSPPPILRKLVTLPCHLILNFTPDNYLADTFTSEGLRFNTNYLSPLRPPPAQVPEPKMNAPVIYNAFGSIADNESLILTAHQLNSYYESVFSRNVVPSNIMEALTKADIFIFLGFPFDRWFMPMILTPFRIISAKGRLLTFGNAPPTAQEQFWYDNLNIEFHLGLEEAVDQLHSACKEEGLLRTVEQERGDIHDTIINYIEKGNVEASINLLLDSAKNEDIQEEALLLSGRYHKLKRQYNSALVARTEYDVELKRMTMAIFSLAKELKETRSFSTPTPSPIGRDLEVADRKANEQLIQRRKKEIKPEERVEIVALNTDLASSPLLEKIQHKFERAQTAEAEKDWHEALRLYEKTISISANYLPAWQGLQRITEQLEESEKQAIAADNVKLLETIIQFEQNARLPLYLQKLEIKEVAAYGSFSWQFQPRMNVLLGRNGYGKSFLLRLVVAMLQNEYEITTGYFENNDIDALARLQVSRKGELMAISRDKLVFQEQFGKVPVLAISDLRFLNRANNEIGRQEGPNADLRENGALHFLQNIPYSDLIQTFLYELCLEYLDNNKSFELGIFRLIHHIIQQLTDDEFRFHSIERRDGARFHIKVITEGNPEPLPIQYASQGTLSILSIFGLIYKYLKALNPEVNEDKVLQCPGIVVIDEVDAHLHPTWQQKVTMLLKETFPKVQFILTAHNPLVVAGCREREAAVFRKTENGFRVQQFERHFIGADSTEIYWAIFETEEKDPTYLKYAAMRPFKQKYETELTELMNKYHLAEDEYEQLSQLTERVERYLANFEEPPEVTKDTLAQALTGDELQVWTTLNKKRIPDAADEARINELNDILFYIGQYERIEEKQKEERHQKLRSKR